MIQRHDGDPIIIKFTPKIDVDELQIIHIGPYQGVALQAIPCGTPGLVEVRGVPLPMLQAYVGDVEAVVEEEELP